jgi:uncharacterized protein (TIGR03435 family)
MRRIVRAAVALVLAMAAQAQQQPAARVEFEVVSVKPGDPAFHGSSVRTNPGSLEMRNTTLKNLVRSAYQLNEYQLEGGPKWMDSAIFNIDAKLPAGAPRDQMPLMFQALVADRFKLQFHRVTKTLPEYALVVAKGGPKVPVASEEDRNNGRSSQGDRQIKGWGLPISSLANMLIGVVGAPVLDRTGLEGKYNFILEFAPLLETPRADETLPSIFEALQEKLGLKLEPTKGPVEVVVIDGAEKPAEN